MPMGEQEKRVPGPNVVRNLRRFRWTNGHAKRLECVQLAGAVVRRGEVQKREQAPRTPNASRNSVGAVSPQLVTYGGVMVHQRVDGAAREMLGRRPRAVI